MSLSQIVLLSSHFATLSFLIPLGEMAQVSAAFSSLATELVQNFDDLFPHLRWSGSPVRITPRQIVIRGHRIGSICVTRKQYTFYPPGKPSVSFDPKDVGSLVKQFLNKRPHSGMTEMELESIRSRLLD